MGEGGREGRRGRDGEGGRERKRDREIEGQREKWRGESERQAVADGERTGQGIGVNGGITLR